MWSSFLTESFGLCFGASLKAFPCLAQTIFPLFGMVPVVCLKKDKLASCRKWDDQIILTTRYVEIQFDTLFGKDREFVFLVDDYRYTMTHS